MNVKASDFLKEQVKPIVIHNAMTVKQLIEAYGQADAFNAGRLHKACEIFERMLKDNCVIGVSIAGALTPAGLNGTLCEMIKSGQIDVLVSTGANIYHDLHIAMGMPFYKGDCNVNDEVLREKRLDRVYDVWVPEDSLEDMDDTLCHNIFPAIAEKYTYPSTAEFHYELGRILKPLAKNPEQSVTIQAFEYGVPIFCPSPADSSIGMTLAKHNLFNNPKNPLKIDVDKDVVYSAALMFTHDKTGAVIAGGGSPKNFLLQTMPMLEQILKVRDQGHDYVIQLTVDSPQYGGLSGATPSEAISWGKVKGGRGDNLVVVYGDVTISLPIMAAYCAGIRRSPRRLIEHLEEAEGLLKKSYLKTLAVLKR